MERDTAPVQCRSTGRSITCTGTRKVMCVKNLFALQVLHTRRLDLNLAVRAV